MFLSEMHMAARRKASTLGLQLVDLATAVPSVVGHRVARLATAGPAPSKRDRNEFRRMGQEKSEAFAESFRAMSIATLQANQRMALTLMRTAWLNPLGTRPSPIAIGALWHSALVDVLGKGVAPVRRRAAANARRLAHAKPRRRAPD
jgi:hypothetical protein